MQSGKLFNSTTGAIRNTSPTISVVVKTATHEATFFAASNGLNQNAAIQYQGSIDGVTWFNLGSAATVNAGATGTQLITEPWPQLRATATCSVAPASGVLTLWWVARGRTL